MKKTALLGLAAVIVSLPAFAGVKSGLAAGEAVSAFHPTHIAGPDKGTDKCPPCTYGNRPAVQVWVNGDSNENVLATQKILSNAVKNYAGKEFKAFVIVMTSDEKSLDTAQRLAEDNPFDNVAIALIPHNHAAVKSYKVNPDASVKNTVMIYKDRKVVANMVNFVANEKGAAALNSAIEKVAK